MMGTHKIPGELRIMTAQHWDESLQELDNMMEGFGLEVARLYLQNMERAMIDPEAVVTEEDARQFVEKIKGDVAFERMMINFVKEVAEWPPADCVLLMMNSKHLQWIRNMHQKYQRLKMYTSARKDPLAQLNGHKMSRLYGFPITIDESVTEPKLE